MRPAQPADDAVLAGLEAVAWSAASGFPSVIKSAHDPDVRFFNSGHPPEAHLVADAGGEVVGYVRLKPPTHLPENKHVLQVQGLAVDGRQRTRLQQTAGHLVGAQTRQGKCRP